MIRYRRLQVLVAVVLAVEFGVGMGSEIPPRHEVFPFASWFLFALVPNHPKEYDLEIRAVDGRVLTKPVRFSRAEGTVLQPHSITAFNVIQQLGLALDRGHADEGRALRQQIDGFCGAARVQYEVVKIVYDPVARYDTGAALQRRVLGTFVTREP